MLIPIIAFLVGLAGAGLLAFGAWLILPAAGYIVAGLLCLVWSYLTARAAGRNTPPSEEGS